MQGFVRNERKCSYVHVASSVAAVIWNLGDGAVVVIGPFSLGAVEVEAVVAVGGVSVMRQADLDPVVEDADIVVLFVLTGQSSHPLPVRA
jgi:hypothetical protein